MNAKHNISVIDLDALGIAQHGWSALPIGAKPAVGIPWTFEMQGVATIVVDGNEYTGEIKSVNHVSAARFANPSLMEMLYAVSPGGWPQIFSRQFGGGVLLALYSVLDGEMIYGFTPVKRFLYITQGQPTLVDDIPGRFVGAGGNPFDSIHDLIKGISGLEDAKLIFPIPDTDGTPLPGTMQNRATTWVKDDVESDKVGVMFIRPELLKPNGVSNHRILDIEYKPDMPPADDKSKESDALRKDIKFLQSVLKAEFKPWWEYGVRGVDGIVMAQVLRVQSAIKAGLLPTE